MKYNHEIIAAAVGLAPEHQPLLAALAHVIDDAFVEHTEGLAAEVARLRARVERPDLQKYTIDEACERIKRGRSSVYNLMQKGELVPVKERGRTYLTEEEIQRWERAQRN